jgi:putative membrane protein insertion efficiency factor
MNEGTEANRWIQRTCPTGRAGLGAIAAYRRWLSPRLPTGCRYTPACSWYGTAAIERYGLRDGLRLTAARLQRCVHSVRPGTTDPVP